MFATRLDLLARSNARRLAQLAVPADMPMPPEDGLRAAIEGRELDDYTQADRDILTQALATIDNALSDADALILSYGIPPATVTPLLARLASTVALYNLYGAERVTKDVQAAYDGAERTLKAHARGELNLVPAAPSETLQYEDAAIITSGRPRYGRRASCFDQDGDE